MDDVRSAAAVLAAELAVETERGRRLPPALVRALKDAGLLRLGVPAAAGGPEMAPMVALEAVEELARADGSAGWCVAIAITSSLVTGYLDAETGRALLGAPDRVAAGVWAPRGTAEAVPGGYRVSGRWAFCSGITHADWLFGGCVLGDAAVVAALPVAELEIVDTWDVAGLRGTGSHDAVAHGVAIPTAHVATLSAGPRFDTPLYRFPLFGFFAASVATVGLGIARGAIDDLVALAGAKRPQDGARSLAERATTQVAVAQAEASLRAARAFLAEAVAVAWDAARVGVPTEVARRDIRLAATYAARTAASVARDMYDLGGASALYEPSSLARRFRDAHAVTAHFQVAPATYELTGRMLLGLPTRTALL